MFSASWIYGLVFDINWGKILSQHCLKYFLCSFLSFFLLLALWIFTPLVVFTQSLDRQAFYSPMIKSQSFSEPVLLDCEFKKCFSLFPLLLCRAGGLGCARVGISLLPCGRLEPADVGYFPSPHQLASDSIPASQALINCGHVWM